MRVKQRQIRFLEAAEIDKILSGIEDDPRGRRDRALIEVLFSTGMRISEALALSRLEMIPVLDEEGTSEFPIIGKGGWQRVVYFSPRCKKALAAWLIAEHANDLVFDITPRTAQFMVARRADWVGIKQKVTPHMFRHSLATDLLRKGVDIRFVSEFLGHRSLNNTMIYTHVVSEQLKTIHKKLYS